MDDARLLHGGKFSFGDSHYVKVQAAGFGKNQMPGQVRKWWRTGWNGGESVKPSKERTSVNSRSRLETHFGVERSAAHREEDVSGEKGNKIAGELGEEFLKTFWLATSNRRL